MEYGESREPPDEESPNTPHPDQRGGRGDWN
jgi:hypothetical protein